MMRISGHKVRLARLIHGKSLKDIGDLLGKSRQYISQIELEAVTPNENLIKKLALNLDVKPNFFENNNSYQYLHEEYVHFRKRAITSQSIKSKAIATGIFIEEIVKSLDKIFKLPNSNFKFHYSLSSIKDIENLSLHYREQLGLGLGPISNMTRLLESVGIFVTNFFKMEGFVDAFSFYRKYPIIILNRLKQSSCRIRFDLAHELGHILMHEGVTTGDFETEQQANRFASSFLLPQTSFISEFHFLQHTKRINWNKVFEFKKRWKVSAAAIIRRAYDLGLISDTKYKNANIYLRKNGQSKTEKFDDCISFESPSILQSAFKILKKENSIQNLCNDLKIDTTLLKKLLNVEEKEKREKQKNIKIFNIGDYRKKMI